MGKLKLIISGLMIFTGLFWPCLPKGSYYLLIAIILFLMAFEIFSRNKNSFGGFLLISFTFNNLLDELFFNPKVIQLNEIVILILIPLIWCLKKRYESKV
ncbi:hypothetical protein [Flavobacterium phage V157]|uniref:Transmembrane protein n=12 Tax=Ficleduovirus FCV1 TaxID=2560474 RepID=A0A218M898_9CAUD|nr:hypothetical protein FDG55_gp14 [Flavobacterium phage FCV-1]ASD51598.1 hypothetical protein [Flavobacterium phage FCV-3]ASD51672.1 hypothetical protein [Flavobacterium phage FCV-11]ASD51746.1 hypothetical protein [Flavobacterium phage V175]ASD51824.1 hypothetical protein [Flavobacterium phage V181]ASD52502.1 hypothetical protein [Flavobacterium phage FCV-10]ASD52575.1 hypothetical protein [Flavobacterium phage FCV-16]ASD52649.1 hypothetical protein [Flavobacterium phage FCV-20]ASD52722.1